MNNDIIINNENNTTIDTVNNNNLSNNIINKDTADISNSNDKKRKQNEIEIEIKIDEENEKKRKREEQRTAAQNAMDCMLILRRLVRGRTIVVVKDERTASQLRDYIVHGEVRRVVCV